MPQEIHAPSLLKSSAGTVTPQHKRSLSKTGALQNAIFNSANFSSIATDAHGVIQIFNVGAERMLGYTAAEVLNKITPAEISDPQELITRARTLSTELSTPIMPGFEALVFKASRGIEDIYELTYIRKDGSHFPAIVSVTALRDTQNIIIGYLLIGTDNTARKKAEEALLKAGALQNAIFNSENFSSIATDEKGVIQIFNVGAERMLGYAAAEVLNKITPADISDPQEIITRAKALSLELATMIRPGFDALVFKASRGIEDIYELTYIRKDSSRFPAIVSVTALRDAQNAIIGYLLIGTDNTARKQIEAEQEQLGQRLRDQQFYTRSLFESNIDALMTTDPSGIITDVNKQMEALTSCTRDELIGAPFKRHFTDSERAETGIKLVLREKKITNYELTVRARDGRETVVSYNATTFYDRDRRLQGVFAAARDVTERNRLDQVLQEKNIELESAKAVAEKTNIELLALVAELQSRDREMKLLIHMDDLLQSCTSVTEAYKVIAFMAKDLFQGQNGALAILQTQNQQLETVARWGKDAIIESTFLSKDCWAMRRGQLHEVIDPKNDLLCQHFVHAPETGTLCLPLMVQGETLGLLSLVGNLGGEHSISQRQLIVTVAEAIKLSLSNIKLRVELREQAICDPLTGLYNRRYMEESLSRELFRSQRQKTELCIAIIDIDHFKQVNDSFGHGAGDLVLREVGRILEEHLRNTDITCRYGGDEFLLVLPDSSSDDTYQRLEQIRLLIKEQAIRYGEKLLNPITVSIGIAAAAEHSFIARELIRAADEALYTAKQIGNDQVFIHTKNKKLN